MATKAETEVTIHSPGVNGRADVGLAQDRQVADYLPLVRRICNRYKHSGEPLEDLVQVGTIGLIKVNEKFDPDRGSHFVSYAVPVIVGEIKTISATTAGRSRSQGNYKSRSRTWSGPEIASVRC